MSWLDRSAAPTTGSAAPDTPVPEQPTGAAPPRLVLDHISKTFPPRAGLTSVTAIRDITSEIEVGSFVSIIGPSGCGKSTLLEILAGLSRPTSGRVLFDGQTVTQPTSGIAVVFQEDSTLPWRTVRRNVELPLELRKIDPAERRARVDEILELVGLRDFAEAHPRELSGGMRQRVAIARALISRPRLLLMDEPFGALDQQTRLAIGEELRRIWMELGQTIIFVTHDINEAAYLGTELWLLTRRPCVIRTRMAIPWARSQNLVGVLKRPEFAELTATMWEMLRSEAQAAMLGDS